MNVNRSSILPTHNTNKSESHDVNAQQKRLAQKTTAAHKQRSEAFLRGHHTALFTICPST